MAASAVCSGSRARLAADAARSDPGRTAATATGLMIGLALVVAVNSLGASFLSSIEDEFDRSFARDLTVQPRGFAPGPGPQQTIDRDLRGRLAKIPEAAVVARERFLFVPDLPGPKGERSSDGLLFAFEPAAVRARRPDRDHRRERASRRSTASSAAQVTIGKG